MSRNTKIVFGVVAGLLLLCVCGAVATLGVFAYTGMTIGRAVESSAAQANTMAARIADFQLPPGYRSEVALDLGGYLFLSYAPGDGHSHIMLVQAPASANLDAAALEQYARQVAESHGYSGPARSQVVGQHRVTIRGQAVTLVIQEGTNANGEAYRSLIGVFQGKGGPALLSIQSPISHWNQGEVDAFIASIQ